MPGGGSRLATGTASPCVAPPSTAPFCCSGRRVPSGAPRGILGSRAGLAECLLRSGGAFVGGGHGPEAESKLLGLPVQPQSICPALRRALLPCAVAPPPSLPGPGLLAVRAVSRGRRGCRCVAGECRSRRCVFGRCVWAPPLCRAGLGGSLAGSAFGYVPLAVPFGLAHLSSTRP